jgi:hypothetical protein
MDYSPSFTSDEANTSANPEVTSPTFKKVVIGDATLYLGEAADVLPHLSDIDSCVADGPYGLSFMGKAWDYDVPKADLWALIHAALKPGSHVVNFASARTYHRMAVEVENGGFEIRDQMMWLYGSGFPKSRDVSKDLDAKRGFKREVVGTVTCPGYADAAALHGAQTQNVREFAKLSSDPISDEAKHWEGWGTALKPAHEPIVLARKPLPTKRTPTYRNLIDHSVGALNIDGCRVASADDNPSIFRRKGSINHLSDPSASESEAEGKLVSRQSPEAYRAPRKGEELGRWPANVIHDGSDVVLSEFPKGQVGEIGAVRAVAAVVGRGADQRAVGPLVGVGLALGIGPAGAFSPASVVAQVGSAVLTPHQRGKQVADHGGLAPTRHLLPDAGIAIHAGEEVRIDHHRKVVLPRPLGTGDALVVLVQNAGVELAHHRAIAEYLADEGELPRLSPPPVKAPPRRDALAVEQRGYSPRSYSGIGKFEHAPHQRGLGFIQLHGAVRVHHDPCGHQPGHRVAVRPRMGAALGPEAGQVIGLLGTLLVVTEGGEEDFHDVPHRQITVGRVELVALYGGDADALTDQIANEGPCLLRALAAEPV